MTMLHCDSFSTYPTADIGLHYFQQGQNNAPQIAPTRVINTVTTRLYEKPQLLAPALEMPE